MNFPTAFSAPDSSATSDMHNRYGNAIRDMVTARSNFSGSLVKPGAIRWMIHGIANIATIDRTTRIRASPDTASEANDRAASRPSPSRRLVNSGTNAAFMAPSPNQRRNRFGNRKAITNASAIGPAPSRAANAMSRKNPMIRETSVSPPTVAKAR